MSSQVLTVDVDVVCDMMVLIVVHSVGSNKEALWVAHSLVS